MASAPGSHPFESALRDRFPDVNVETAGEAGNAVLPAAGQGRLTVRLRWEPATIEVAVEDDLPGGPCETVFAYETRASRDAAREAVELVEDLLEERVVVVRLGTKLPRLARTAGLSADEDFDGTIRSWHGTYDSGRPVLPLQRADRLTYPALVFATDGTITVADSPQFFSRGSARAVRARWFDGLAAVDGDGRRWRVARAKIRHRRGRVGRFWDRLRNASIDLDCVLDPTGWLTHEELQHRLVDATNADAGFWEAGWGEIAALETAITQARSHDDLVALFR